MELPYYPFEPIKLAVMTGLASIQLPIYGWLFGMAFQKKKPMIACSVVGLHALAAAILFR